MERISRIKVPHKPSTLTKQERLLVRQIAYEVYERCTRFSAGAYFLQVKEQGSIQRR